jgi:pimeloyl-ACP methyl ester carboxylesterase
MCDSVDSHSGRRRLVTLPSNQAIQPRFRTIDGLSIRYAESHDGAEHALLLGPWPESLHCYAQTWSRLAERAHLVAIDLPGFGHSERRDGLMSPQQMGGFIIRVADEFGLENPHVVGPDVGTNAALFAAASQPGRLRSLVVGSGGAAVPIQLGGALKDWVEDPDFEHYRHADPRKIVAAALATIERYQIPPDIYEDYLSAYDGDRFFESMRYARTYPAQLPVLRDLLPGIQTPVQNIAGGHDRAVPPANSEFLHRRLPHSKLDILDAGHFTWEDSPDEYAALITAWWAGGYATV